MKIRKSAVIQYALIYMMMVFNGGILYPYLQSNMSVLLNAFVWVIVGVGVVFCFFKPVKYGNKYCLLISFILFGSVVIVRYTVGGVGLGALMFFCDCIMLTFLAVCVDKKNFSTRLINMVYCIAAISIVCYLLQLMVPDLLKSVITSFKSGFSYNDWSSGYEVQLYQIAWGKFFFTMREGEMTRNLGIFSEPGNYQIVLNVVLYILFFLPEFYEFTQKQLKKRFIVIIVALLTCQSTSGYLIFLVLCVAFFISKKQYANMSSIRRIFVVLIFVALGALVIDYNIRGNESLLNTAVFSKIFDDGSVDVAASTGYWRIGVIGITFVLMLSHPFGSGVDTVAHTVQTQLGGSGGGALMTFGATLGIIPFVATILWFIGPVLKEKRLDMPARIAFLVMYFQISFAQSKVFYPFLVAIVVLLVVTRYAPEEMLVTNDANMMYESVKDKNNEGWEVQ